MTKWSIKRSVLVSTSLASASWLRAPRAFLILQCVGLVAFLLPSLKGTEAAAEDTNRSAIEVLQNTNQNAVKPAIPDQFKLSLMIRSTIIAVNQANKTGNYTVLRDLSSPGFQKANSAKQLATTFKDLRESKFDLSPILFFNPKLVRAPAITNDGILRLTGFFDTRPQLVTFDFLFEQVGTEWLLFGINIGTQLAPKGQASAAPKQNPGADASTGEAQPPK